MKKKKNKKYCYAECFNKDTLLKNTPIEANYIKVC